MATREQGLLEGMRKVREQETQGMWHRDIACSLFLGYPSQRGNAMAVCLKTVTTVEKDPDHHTVSHGCKWAVSRTGANRRGRCALLICTWPRGYHKYKHAM
jgi:hypothetical protein